MSPFDLPAYIYVLGARVHRLYIPPTSRIMISKSILLPIASDKRRKISDNTNQIVSDMIYDDPNSLPSIRSRAIGSEPKCDLHLLCVAGERFRLSSTVRNQRERTSGGGSSPRISGNVPIFLLLLRDPRDGGAAWLPEDMEGTGMISGVPARQEGRKLWQYLASISGIWATVCISTVLVYIASSVSCWTNTALRRYMIWRALGKLSPSVGLAISNGSCAK